MITRQGILQPILSWNKDCFNFKPKVYMFYNEYFPIYIGFTRCSLRDRFVMHRKNLWWEEIEFFSWLEFENTIQAMFCLKGNWLNIFNLNIIYGYDN